MTYRRIFSPYIPVHRAIRLAGAEIPTFLVHAECVPCGGAEDIFYRSIVHADRNPQHGAQGDKIRADVTVTDRAVIGAPVVHHVVCAGERIGLSALPEAVVCVSDYIAHFIRQYCQEKNIPICRRAPESGT